MVLLQDPSPIWSNEDLLWAEGKPLQRTPVSLKKFQNKRINIRDTVNTVGSLVEYSYSIDIYEDNTPFEQLIDIEDKERKDLIEGARRSSLPYAEKIYHRLNILTEASEEEYPNTDLISVDSLYGFLKLFKEFEKLNFKYPEITLTPLGNIRIQWQGDKEHYLSVEFISNQEVKIVLFTPDNKVIGKISRISAKMPIVSIFENLQPYRVLTWITE
ncbi:MAG: hypothetical protein H0X47_07685 [Nitrospirales bacterium]|nr:hypothetical protein [Nitrospirales bacterium]